MKPRIFLSHSKADKTLIEKLANDLRSARIDVWYDEWEIPSGESFRQQIVKGIEETDLFFIYLTSTSIKSYWVQHELDTAFVKQVNSGRKVLALFVDNELTRSDLSLDLKALHSPVLSNDEYLRPFSQLISRAWESYMERIAQDQNSKFRLAQLELENKVKDLELTIARKDLAATDSPEETIERLKSKIYLINDEEISSYKLFSFIANDLATSETLYRLDNIILDRLGLKTKPLESLQSIRDFSEHNIRDIIGPYIILDLVHMVPAAGEIIQDYYYLTERGKRVAAKTVM